MFESTREKENKLILREKELITKELGLQKEEGYLANHRELQVTKQKNVEELFDRKEANLLDLDKYRRTCHDEMLVLKTDIVKLEAEKINLERYVSRLKRSADFLLCQEGNAKLLQNKDEEIKRLEGIINTLLANLPTTVKVRNNNSNK